MEKETIKIKNSWDEVTLGEFLRISDIDQDPELAKTVVKKSIKLIDVISDMEYGELLDLEMAVMEPLIEIASFLHTEPQASKEKTFKIDGVEYMMHPNLNKLNNGESISLESMLMQAEERKSDIVPDILAILIRPAIRRVDPEFPDKTILEIEKFDENKIAMRRELFLEKLTVPFFITALTSFSNGEMEFEKIIQSYLQAKSNTTKKGTK
jgi:hypothetical protein